MKKDTEKKFKVFNSFAQQTNNFCWTLDKPESTMSLGSTLTKKFPDLRILLLIGPLGAGKTTLVKGIAKSLRIKEPITSPTFPLSQHYPLGSPPLIHLDLYRIEEQNSANEFFLQEEEESTENNGIDCLRNTLIFLSKHQVLAEITFLAIQQLTMPP